MARKRYSDEDVLRLLKKIEVHLSSGMDVVSACRHAGISDKTYSLGQELWSLWLSQDSSAFAC